MPYRDGTGPMGDGRPGRGMGPCGRGAAPCGRGRRMGGGRGFGGRGFAALNTDSVYQYSKENLEAQKKELEAQLNWINKELEN